MASNQIVTFDDQPPPEPREGWLLVRIYVPELHVYKCLQFPSDKLVWDVKQQCLASLPKELKESFNYGLFCPPSNGKAGKFLDEERRLGDYPFNGPVGYLELKYKRRVYKMTNFDERQLRSMHTRSNLRRFIEYVNTCHVDKISKMCDKGLDPNFHCEETGETPLTIATGNKKPQKLIIALVNGGALLDFRTKDGSTALHKAVERNKLEALQTLLELGASPNYRDAKGFTPVYLSVAKKTDPKMTKALLHDHGVLGTQDTQGWQEVHQACRNGLVQHLEYILAYGADMNSRNASGNTPLHVCAVNNQTACARMLLFRGAQRDALNFANQTPYQVAVIADNLKLAEIIQNFNQENVEIIRDPPSYNPRRRSGIGWGQLPSIAIDSTTIGSGPGAAHNTSSQEMPGIHNHHTQISHHPHHHHHHHHSLSRMNGAPPSPCPSEHPFSSASSSLSESSSSHRSHEDDISIVTDKSLGDTSDSSGVVSNFETAACSIGHPNTTVVCMEKYMSTMSGHLTIQPGDVIEVVGSTDCGLLEGYIRSTTQTGFFPSHCVQEVQFRQKYISQVSTASTATPNNNNNNTISNNINNNNVQSQQQKQQPSQQQQQQQTAQPQQATPPQSQSAQQQPQSQPTVQQPNSLPADSANSHPPQMQPDMPQQSQATTQFNSATAPRIKKNTLISEPRTVLLHRAKRGFGFILRGAKAASPLMLLKPSARCPALQYLDDVDPGGVADLAGLFPGDFLLAINGIDVTCASHEYVVELIRTSGAVVSMTVLTLPRGGNPAMINSMNMGNGTIAEQSSGNTFGPRQCATLPRRLSGPGNTGRLPAPKPPTRDPRTTLSVGRARAKSMVAGLEGSSEKDDDEVPTKSSSAESIHQQSQSAVSTPTQGGPGTPVRPRTASIKARPSSSRITAAELEELFQRQQGADGSNRCSAMMTTSHFQSGMESGAATPPMSPTKGPIVYASIAEMKRKKTKNGTLRGRPVPIPQVASELRRNFHSTPDLADLSSAFSLNNTTSSSSSNIQASFSSTFGSKGHRSNDDMHSIHISMQRLNLPPPNHPPPPPPVGQVVKVDVSRRSEYDNTLTLQKQLQEKLNKQQPGDKFSSFKPPTVYSSPQDSRASSIYKSTVTTTVESTVTTNVNPYAQSGRIGVSNNQQQQPEQQRYSDLSISAPPIPDPDYSLSESDGEGDSSVRLATSITTNTTTIVKKEEVQIMQAETSGNSNTSGSSTGSSSIPHSFSVDEIQKIQTKLKSSKSYPNDFGKIPNQQQDMEMRAGGEGEGDSSSSGVSSDQEVTITLTTTASDQVEIIKNQQNQSSFPPPPEPITIESKKVTIISSSVKNSVPVQTDVRSDDEDDQSPSPPLKGFQRHNSLTRKQAATIAANRAKAIQMQQRHAVTLAQLPPPLEADSDEADNGGFSVEPFVAPPPPEFSDNVSNHHYQLQPNQQFVQQIVHHQQQQQQHHMQQAPQQRSVRIVGAVPKMIHHHHHHHHHH